MMMMRLVLLGCILLSGCQPVDDLPQKSADANTYFPISIGENTLQLQLALTPAERQKGLMFREALPADHGMLFLMDRPQPLGFWMQNTRIPLDIGYFDASGQLQEIYKLFPYDENQIQSRSRELLIAVETNQGWYTRNAVSPGAQLDMDALKAAVAKRGYSIADYAIQD